MDIWLHSTELENISPLNYFETDAPRRSFTDPMPKATNKTPKHVDRNNNRARSSTYAVAVAPAAADRATFRGRLRGIHPHQPSIPLSFFLPFLG